MRSCPKTQLWPLYGCLALEANWNSEKVWYVAASWAERKSKISSFWSAAFSYSTQEQWNISRSDFDMWQKVDFTQPPVTTSSVVAWRRSSQALPKAKLAPKKCHGHCLVVCGQIHPPQLSESQLNHYIWEACSANGWDAPNLQHLQPALVNRKGPVLLCDNSWPHITQPMLQKLNELGYKVLPHLSYSPDLLPTDYHFFKHLDNFVQEKCFHNQDNTENAFQELIKSQRMDFFCRRSKVISQKCADCSGSCFD